MTYILSLYESDQIILVFAYLCLTKCFLHHKYAKKGFYKELALQWSFVAILWIIEVGGTCKTNIQMALKKEVIFINFDHVNLSLEIIFILSCLMEILLHQLSGSTLIFVKILHQKAKT